MRMLFLFEMKHLGMRGFDGVALFQVSELSSSFKSGRGPRSLDPYPRLKEKGHNFIVYVVVSRNSAV